jgi:hypothetical protein
MPGAFAAIGSAEAPTVELLTFQLGDPLGGLTPPTRKADGTVEFTPLPKTSPGHPRSGGLEEDHYFTILGQSDLLEAWACVEMKGLVLRFPRQLQDREYDEWLTLSTRVGDFERLNDRGGYADGVDGITSITHYLEHTFAKYAIARLVRLYERNVATVRDRVGRVALKRPRRAVSEMQVIERDLLMITRDARPLLNDIIGAPSWVWDDDTYSFLPTHEWRGQRGPLFEGIFKQLVERARDLAEVETETRGTTQAIGALVAAAVNLGAARTGILLAFVAILLSIVATLLSYIAIPDAAQRIRDLFR